ncbi:MAG: type II secretion system protein M [Deltaproteobacteria bacterium]|nr:type II secretion system protein M [Deltaproteobacteria bacterium]
MAVADIMNALRRVDLNALYNTFLGFSPRQQTVVLAGGGLTILLILILPISIAAGKLGSLESQIVETQDQIDTVIHDIQGYKDVQERLQAIEQQFRQQTGESLLTLIQGIASQMNLSAERPAERGRESYEYYEEEMVSFHLKAVPLEQLVKFLHAVESARQRIVRIKEIIIAPVYGNRQLLNAELNEVAAYRLVAEEK